MDKPHHFWIGLVVFTIINLMSSQITITLIAIPVAMTLFPDIDCGTKKHRWFLTHSILIWIIVWIFNPMLLTALIVFSIGLHCLCDFRRKKVGGFYTIKFGKILGKNKGLNYKWSSIWLIINFIGGCIILLVWLIIF